MREARGDEKDAERAGIDENDSERTRGGPEENPKMTRRVLGEDPEGFECKYSNFPTPARTAQAALSRRASAMSDTTRSPSRHDLRAPSQCTDARPHKRVARNGRAA